MLFITHDLRVAVQISDNIAVMHEGRVVEHGPALDVFSNPSMIIRVDSSRRRQDGVC